MSSLRRILSSRANGARSRGPVTPEGKARSSRNSIRHGLLAKCVVLSNESPAGFQELHDQFVNRFGPADGVEEGLLEEMVSAYWRLRRAWAIETRLLDDSLADQPPGDELGRMADAFKSLASRPELALIHRYEARLHAISQRALYNFLLLRAGDMPNEPTRTHPVAALALPESAPSLPAPEPPSSIAMDPVSAQSLGGPSVTSSGDAANIPNEPTAALTVENEEVEEWRRLLCLP
ncbi:MAG: hypothetical protein LLG20_05695 [Acidobacteriales bacterium]|nr:hypothetical protein [Terriglobales bacterium]